MRSSLSFEGSLSVIEYVTGENVGFVAVSVHDVVSPTCSAVGSQALVNVTAAWRRTIVTGT